MLELAAKGTVRNKEVLSRNHYQRLADVDLESFRELVELWVLDYAELYSAAGVDLRGGHRSARRPGHVAARPALSICDSPLPERRRRCSQRGSTAAVGSESATDNRSPSREPEARAAPGAPFCCTPICKRPC